MFEKLMKIFKWFIFLFLAVFALPDKFINRFIADAFKLVSHPLSGYQFRAIAFNCHPLFCLQFKFVGKTDLFTLYFMALPGFFTGFGGYIPGGIDTAAAYIAVEFPADSTAVNPNNCSDLCLGCCGTL